MTDPLPSAAAPSKVASKAAVLKRLELEVTRRLDGMLTGDYLAVSAGPGSERSWARKYEPGDDARQMDWNLSARSLLPHVRTTEADREMETWVIADRSASLDFGTADREKREVVLAATAAFGFLTARHGNRLGVVIAGGDRVIRLPARSGRLALLAALSALHDSPRSERGPGSSADLGAALRTIERAKLRRGQIVVVSDFLDASDWSSSMRRLALRHQLVACHVTDPRELHLPAVGMLGVIDPETGRRLHVQTNSSVLRQRYEEAATARLAEIRSTVVRARAEYLHLSTDRDWLVDFARFVATTAAHRRAHVRKLALG